MIRVGDKKIHIKQGDITEETTDAIVNPANSQLVHGGGAARAIAVKGGAMGEEQSRHLIEKIGQVPTGKAVITDAGNLPCKFVIHTVGPIWGESEETVKLRRAVWSVLTLAELYNLKSVSMPAISSGVFGFPKDLCAEILLATTVEFLRQPTVALEEVFLCNHDPVTVECFLAAEQKYRLRYK